MERTVYADVTRDDVDVAAFVAAHPHTINLRALPVKMWVARQGGAIVAVLMLSTVPYVCLDLILADPASRPFFRIINLWFMAEDWLKSRRVPIICIAIHNSLAHYQSLVRRFGFEKVGVEPNGLDEPVETVFAKRLLDRDEAELQIGRA
jgi:hypothetical protein